MGRVTSCEKKMYHCITYSRIHVFIRYHDSAHTQDLHTGPVVTVGEVPVDGEAQAPPVVLPVAFDDTQIILYVV